VENGFDHKIKDRNGLIPADVSRQNNHSDCFEFLNSITKILKKKKPVAVWSVEDCEAWVQEESLPPVRLRRV
jgi:hypothetical protein